MKYITYIACIVLSGCTTIIEPKIESVKPWEQHYMTVEAFEAGTKDIKLDANETIWVISNKTLNRLLMNIK